MEIIGEALQNLGFDWKVALANLVNFLIVFWLLKRFLWKPLRSKIDERKRVIEEGIQKAEEAEKLREEANEAHTKMLDEAKSERAEIVQGARAKEQEIVDEARTKANTEALRIAEDAKKRVETERREADALFEKESALLVVQGVEKVLREKIGKEESEKIIHSLVSAQKS